MHYTDEYIEHWAAVYEQYKPSLRTLSFEQFLTNPWGYIVELAGDTDMLPLLPQQAAVARRLETQDFPVVSEQTKQNPLGRPRRRSCRASSSWRQAEGIRTQPSL